MASSLETATHAELFSERERGDAATQEALAPYEHRAFAREWSEEAPLQAAVSLPFAIPAYTAAKAAGLTNARSPASFEEMKQAYIGLYEGLSRSFSKK